MPRFRACEILGTSKAQRFSGRSGRASTEPGSATSTISQSGMALPRQRVKAAGQMPRPVTRDDVMLVRGSGPADGIRQCPCAASSIPASTRPRGCSAPRAAATGLDLDAKDAAAAFQKAQLLQPLQRLKPALVRGRVFGQRLGPIGVDADMVIDRRGLARAEVAPT